MADYELSDRIKQEIQKLIPQFHPHLISAKIACVMKKAPENSPGPTPPKRMGKWPKMATARTVSTLHNLLSGYDFILEVDEKYWDTLELAQQTALIDHELSHMARDEDGFYLKDHDVEEYVEIVRRHGCWKHPLPELREVMQLQLGFEEPAEKAKAASA